MSRIFLSVTKRLASTTTLHAYYSPTAAQQYGDLVYLDIHKKEVRVTEVTQEPPPMSQWKDLAYIGKVIHYNDGGFVRGRSKSHF